MRIALIILSILALIFIGAISWSLVNQEGWKVRIPTISSTAEQIGWSNSADTIALETWKNQMKTDEKLEKLTDIVEDLAKKNGSYTEEVSTKDVIESGPKELPAVKPSGKFLALIMPTITPVLEKNSWIFGLYIFDLNVRYSTYKDNNFALTIIPMDIAYDTLLKNLKALAGKPYSLNETQNFLYRSFFLNPEVSDTMVRLVIEIENQTIAMEIPKSKYDVLKTLLLWKQPTASALASSGVTVTRKPTIVAPVVNSTTPKTGTAR
jgi:hypothetical protein